MLTMEDEAKKIIGDHKNPLQKTGIVGPKLFLSNSSKETQAKINKNLESLQKVLEHQKVEKRCSRAKADWDPSINMARVNKVVKGLLSQFGYQDKSGIYMYPEEMLFLVETTISEMKTSVKRRAREVRYGYRGTGGGAPVKPLTDLEERLLHLISKLSVEGVDIIVVYLENHGGPSTLPEGSSVLTEGPSILAEVSSTSEDVFIENAPNEIVFTETEETNEETKENENNQNVINTKIEKPQKRKKIISKERMRPGRINNALTEHDKNLKELTKSNYAIAASIRLLAKAVSSLAKK